MEDGNVKGPSSSLQSSNGLRKAFLRPIRSKTTLIEAEGSGHSGRTSRTPSFDGSTEDAARPATSGGDIREGESGGISKQIRRKHLNQQAQDTSMPEELGDDLERRSSRSGESKTSPPALEINGQRRRSMTAPSRKRPMGTDSESDAYVIIDIPYYAFHG